MNDQAMQTEMPPLPKVLGGLVPYLSIDGVFKAAAFYKAAFGAEEAYVYPPDDKGRTMHIHLYINGSSLMMSDGFPEMGHPAEKPQGYTLQLVVDDIDFWFERAVKAGADIVMPVERMFWGDRYGQLRDPFGVLWAMTEPASRP